MMNWRKLDFPNDLEGHDVLIKSISEKGNANYFCGEMKVRRGQYSVSNNGSYYYFRKDRTYYYVNINEIL